jgi:DnaJ like chaperone protein
MWGKIAGGFFGYLLMAPMGLGLFGLLIGWCLGRQFDVSLGSAQRTHSFFYTAHSIRELFFECTFAVMGHIAKADGSVSQQEIKIAEQFMSQLHMSDAARQLAKKAFRRGKDPTFSLDQTLSDLRRMCLFQPQLLQLFLDIQMQVAQVDQHHAPKKQQILAYIMRVLGVSSAYHQDWFSGQSRGGASQSVPNRGVDLARAYQLLGVSKQDSDVQVRRAYKKMMGENHPDRLVAKGLPPEMIKLATQKTQQIKQAYDHIMQQRERAF